MLPGQGGRSGRDPAAGERAFAPAEQRVDQHGGQRRDGRPAPAARCRRPGRSSGAAGRPRPAAGRTPRPADPARRGSRPGPARGRRAAPRPAEIRKASSALSTAMATPSADTRTVLKMPVAMPTLSLSTTLTASASIRPQGRPMPAPIRPMGREQAAARDQQARRRQQAVAEPARQQRGQEGHDQQRRGQADHELAGRQRAVAVHADEASRQHGDQRDERKAGEAASACTPTKRRCGTGPAPAAGWRCGARRARRPRPARQMPAASPVRRDCASRFRAPAACRR